MSAQCAEGLPFECESHKPEDLEAAGYRIGDITLLGEVDCVEIEIADDGEPIDEIVIEPNALVLTWRPVDIDGRGRIVPLPHAS